MRRIVMPSVFAVFCLVTFFCIVFVQTAEQSPSTAGLSRETVSEPENIPDDIAGEPLRWAMISDPAPDSQSLTDLLFAELSVNHDFHFVDRDSVHAVVKEQEISALFGNAALETRLQLGRLLAADRLIVVSETNQIHVLDTGYGLSLFNLPIDLNEDTVEATCKNVAVLIRSVKDRYAGGIHTIVAVPYFVSNSFDRSYDHLQSELPGLLNRTLLQHDGVAVVAFDEIDKILSERALTIREPVQDRSVAVKVTGEISAAMKPSGETSTDIQSFSLRIEIRNGDGAITTIKKDGLRFHELGLFVSTDVAGEILKRSDQNTTPLSIEEQKSLFLKDAVALDGVGAKDLALGMREAAFFLDPDDLDNTVDILMGPCLAKKWTGFTPSPIKDRYRALPFLEQALKSKRLKLMHGLQLIHMVAKTTERRPTYDLDGNIVLPPPLDDDPWNLGNDLVFFQRLFPLLMQLPTDNPSEGPSRTRTDWNGISVQIHNYGPAEQYRAVSQYLDHIFYDAPFDWDHANISPDLIEWKVKANLNKSEFRAVFEMQRSLPKDTVLWKPGFLFHAPALSPKAKNDFEYLYQERLLQTIPRELWMYYCDLWRSTEDDDFMLLADLYELYWLAFNSGKNDNGDWERYGTAKIRKIFEDHWRQPEPGVFVPKMQKRSTLLMYLRSLEIVNGLADAKLEVNDPGTNLVFQLSISSQPVNSRTAMKSEFDALVDSYLRRFNTRLGGDYYRLKNDYFQFRPIPNWDVSLDSTLLRANKWRLPFKHDLANNTEPNGLGSLSQQNFGFMGDLKISIFTRKNNTNGDWQIEKFDESTDILWTSTTMYRLSRKEDDKIDYHFLESTVNPGRTSVTESLLTVKSDGKYIWSAIGPGRYSDSFAEMKLRLSDRDGRVVCTFDASDGLQTSRSPRSLTGRMSIIPHLKNGSATDRFEFRTRAFLQATGRNEWLEDDRTDGSVSVCPVAPGKGLVIGRHGPLLQTWIGVATYDEATGKKDFKLLYGATRNITKDDLETLDSPAQMDVNFSYPWLCLFRDSQHPGRNQVLVGRRFGNYDNSIYATPLLVDLDEEKVMLLTERYPDLHELKGAVSIQCVNDVFVLRRGYRTIEIYHPNNEGGYLRQEVTCTFPANSLSRMDLYLFQAGNAVYAPGPTWYRIDVGNPDMPKCEAIGNVNCTIPTYNKLYRFAPSALFGVWALPRGGDPYMFDPTPVDRDFLPFEAFVPEDRLAKHDAAVKRLRALGAGIGHNSYSDRVFFQNGGYCDGMFAVFVGGEKQGGRWQGTSADLMLLKDVYDLRSVGFVNVELGPEEMQVIADIPTISEVALLSTGVSDEEFAVLPLENYSQLIISEYQSPARLTDKSLERLRGLPNIRCLNFSGAGFTDAAYDIVKTLPNMKVLHCPFGSMSEEIRSKIK